MRDGCGNGGSIPTTQVRSFYSQKADKVYRAPSVRAFYARVPCPAVYRAQGFYAHLTHNNMDALTHRPISPNHLFPSKRAGICGRVMGGENRFLNL
jgi:hypothetical protein